MKMLQVVLCSLLLVAGVCGPAIGDDVEAEVMSVSISGRVVDALTGEPVPAAKVSLFEAQTTCDSKGRFTFKGVPSTRWAQLNIRVLDYSGDVIGCSHLPVPVNLSPLSAISGSKMKVMVVDTGSDRQGLELAVAARADQGLIDECADCHKPNPCTTGVEDEPWDEVTHISGVAVAESELEEFRENLLATGLTPDMYSSLRYQDAHPQQVEMADKLAVEEDETARFKMPDDLALGDGDLITCDTCHTRHQPTEFNAFLVMDYLEDNALCLQCHL